MNEPPLVFVPTPGEAELLFGRPLTGVDQEFRFPEGRLHAVICGLGPISAAALGATWLARRSPARAALVGLAGSYDLDRHPLSSVVSPTHVACDGVGVGDGETFEELPFPLVPEGIFGPEDPGGRIPVESLGSGESEVLLVSVTAASLDARQVARRRRRFPDAAVEAMEDYGLALAAALHGVPLTVIRGISNEAGVRDPERWETPQAMEACREAVGHWLSGGRP